MNSPFDDDLEEQKVFGVRMGVVVDRADPLQLGRIRFRIPGFIEPTSPWARPLTIGGGSANRGLFSVPDLGADVAIWFNDGDIEDPVYMAANWGKPNGVSEVPEEAQKTPPDATVLATEDFRIEVDNSVGSRRLRLSCVATGDNVTIDADRREVLVAATSRVVIQATGAIDIDAAVITIGGRAVRMGIEDPI